MAEENVAVGYAGVPTDPSLLPIQAVIDQTAHFAQGGIDHPLQSTSRNPYRPRDDQLDDPSQERVKLTFSPDDFRQWFEEQREITGWSRNHRVDHLKGTPRRGLSTQEDEPISLDTSEWNQQLVQALTQSNPDVLRPSMPERQNSGWELTEYYKCDHATSKRALSEDDEKRKRKRRKKLAAVGCNAKLVIRKSPNVIEVDWHFVHTGHDPAREGAATRRRLSAAATSYLEDLIRADKDWKEISEIVRASREGIPDAVTGEIDRVPESMPEITWQLIYNLKRKLNKAPDPIRAAKREQKLPLMTPDTIVDPDIDPSLAALSEAFKAEH
ncbi:uncharacterized protein L969DRAFT_51889 [Mixia osmundae IAM 14324]|uniref:Uncharacterized protein n=1 Tax=Mixia osmundae (strain CBS 9802 / IAM 14324 / JCM 22182 / KY 12970) TaxID=764103 RepID=G7DSH3_MIXOS|nr:uncharacterized protein L969DRAFT_51889 [Mixia osmundae IAM 14324]KEI37970.1 hypothetical protein L969DRAFT_51889 [Mixia osmundae IAM 14324]GAA93533.1 hypothetical protein E5Q_00176 [Mixia osmundae IAM 14324]